MSRLVLAHHRRWRCSRRRRRRRPSAPDLTVSKATPSPRARPGRPADGHVDGQERRPGRRRASRRPRSSSRPTPSSTARTRSSAAAPQKAVKASKTATGKLTARIPATLAAALLAAGLRRRAQEGQGELGDQQLPRRRGDGDGAHAPRPAAARRARSRRRRSSPPPSRRTARPRPATATATATPDPDAPARRSRRPARRLALARAPTFSFTSRDRHELRVPARRRRLRRPAPRRRPSPACSRASTSSRSTRSRTAAASTATRPQGLADRVRGARARPGAAPPRAAPETKADAPQADARRRSSPTATEFLYTGADPIQKGVAAGAIEPLQAAVLRGRVVRRNGTPIDGVEVTVLDHPELGRTATRTDGGFDIAVNGGGAVTLALRARGLHPQRSASSRSRRRTTTSSRTIVMVPYEDRVTGVDLSDDGSRSRRARRSPTATARARATLLLDPGTNATATLPDGTTKDLGDRLNIRATEFTIGASGPAAMPGELPPTSAYTYAVEYSVDEADAQQARRRRSSTSRSSPTSTTSSSFPAGTAVPMGYYDREKAQWIGGQERHRDQDRQRVRRPRGSSTSTGDDVADSVAALGIDDAELAQARRALRPRQEPLARRDRRTSRRGTTTGPTACRTAPAARPGRPGRRRPARRRPVQLARLDHPLREPGARRAARRSPARRTRSPTSPTACPAAARATR